MRTPDPAPDIRFNYVRDKRKTLSEWFVDFFQTFKIRRRINEETDEMEKFWRPNFPSTWHFKAGPFMSPGDAGYDEATHAIGFILNKSSFSRQVQECK